jgi:hypothetical protein
MGFVGMWSGQLGCWLEGRPAGERAGGVGTPLPWTDHMGDPTDSTRGGIRGGDEVTQAVEPGGGGVRAGRPPARSARRRAIDTRTSLADEWEMPRRWTSHLWNVRLWCVEGLVERTHPHAGVVGPEERQQGCRGACPWRRRSAFRLVSRWSTPDRRGRGSGVWAEQLGQCSSARLPAQGAGQQVGHMEGGDHDADRHHVDAHEREGQRQGGRSQTEPSTLVPLGHEVAHGGRDAGLVSEHGDACHARLGPRSAPGDSTGQAQHGVAPGDDVDSRRPSTPRRDVGRPSRRSPTTACRTARSRDHAAR